MPEASPSRRARTALSNQLKSELKQYYPLALAILDNDLTTALAADFLLQWPNFESLKKAAAHKLRKFFYGHQSRNEPNSKSGCNVSRRLNP
jgi:hypothetical protein